MSHSASLNFDEALIREAVFCFWRRTIGIGFVIALLLVATSLAALLLQGDRSWYVGVLASAVVLGIAFPAVLFIVHYRNSMKKYQELGSGGAVLTASDGTLSFSSQLGSVSLPWSSVKEIWRFKRVWLVLFSQAQFSTLPISAMSPELQAFILERVKSSGGKVA